MSKGKVFKDLRSLYGLKQAGRDWNLLMKHFFVSLGPKQSLTDPCLYTHHVKRIWLLVYVGHIAATVSENFRLDWFFKILSQIFNAKNLGKIEKILDPRISRDWKTRTFFLNQEQDLSAALDLLGTTHSSTRPKESLLQTAKKSSPCKWTRWMDQLNWVLERNRNNCVCNGIN